MADNGCVTYMARVTLRERKMARYRALEAALSLMNLPRGTTAVGFEWDANPHTDERDRKLIRQEYDSIYWQLVKRHDKLHQELFGG